MCGTCGCSPGAGVMTSTHHHHHGDHDHHHHEGHPHHHHHGEHADHHHHAPDHAFETRRVRLEEDLLAKNDRLARDIRTGLSERGLTAINFVSSPGSGKTTLLERTIRDRSEHRPIVVIQGDQATERDADRVRAAGARAIQVNTGTGCHLDASMVSKALRQLAPERDSLVAIENVGNLVCPALFDLGEHARVALMSVPEGADKPLKYPYIFRGASLVLLNKVDLLPHVDFDVTLFEDCLRQVHPDVRYLGISATRGDGLAEFYAWLDAQARLTLVPQSEAPVSGTRLPTGADPDLREIP